MKVKHIKHKQKHKHIHNLRGILALFHLQIWQFSSGPMLTSPENLISAVDWLCCVIFWFKTVQYCEFFIQTKLTNFISCLVRFWLFVYIKLEVLEFTFILQVPNLSWQLSFPPIFTVFEGVFMPSKPLNPSCGW